MREEAGIGRTGPWSYHQVAIVVGRPITSSRTGGVAQEKFLPGGPLRHPAH